MPKIIIPNARNVEIHDAIQSLDDVYTDALQAEVTARFEIGSERAAGISTETLELDDDSIVEVVLADDSVWYAMPDELAELQSAGRRGGSHLVIDAQLFNAAESRGMGSAILKSVGVIKASLFGEDEKHAAALAKIKDAGIDAAIDGTSYLLARAIEQRNATKGTTRVCRVISGGRGDVALEPVDIIDAPKDSPALILLHGTLSSTNGSFGAIWNGGVQQLDHLRRRYGDRIFALEHNTLTESPVQNAITLSEALPESANVHILSHSRGGLVGELLCHGTRHGDVPFTDADLEAYRRAASESLDVPELAGVSTEIKKLRQADANRLAKLGELLSEREASVSRFVRVACPARGTTLASRRLGRWSNRVLNAVRLVSGMGANPVVTAIKTFTLGVMRAATHPGVLPGIAAQMPDSALIRLLNQSGATLKADLSIVAGDIELESGVSWKSVPIWLTDRFYGDQHDLVVNTASMDGGGARFGGFKRFSVQGDHVNHFSYFSNQSSLQPIIRHLTEGDSPYFKATQQAEDVQIARGGLFIGQDARVKSDGNFHFDQNKPVLLLVPGILGSTLNVDDEKVWMSITRLGDGGIRRLAIDQPGVTASAVFRKAYQPFINTFEKTHNVYTFPYDWRRSLTKLADELNGVLANLLDMESAGPPSQSIRIVAHSMGGLVVRTLAANHPATWSRTLEHDDSRFIMAGTPNGGSYSIANILFGHQRTIKLLALIDPDHSKKDILAIVSKYPGLAAMLPDFGQLKWFDPDTWKQLQDQVNDKAWHPVRDELLAEAARERETLRGSPINTEKMLYVAGVAKATPADARIEDGQLCVTDTDLGDGQVTWESGIPPGINKVWYQNTVHGQLLADPDYQNAWQELVNNGHTPLLLTQRPATGNGKSRAGSTDMASAQTGTGSMPDGAMPGQTAAMRAQDVEIDYLPSEADLVDAAFDILPAQETKKVASAPVVQVSVVHGNLCFARYPVCVGHYKYDQIQRAEAALDRFLDDRLSQRHRMGQYPGDIGTNDVVFKSEQRRIPQGALVVGLGMKGELNGARLERTLVEGIARYVVEYAEFLSQGAHVEQSSSVGLSVLLVGTGADDISVNESLDALLKAIAEVNSMVMQEIASVDNTLNNPDRRLFPIGQLQIIELYEDIALGAVHSLKAMARDRQRAIMVDPLLRSGGGGFKRAHYAPDDDWWQILSIKHNDNNGNLEFHGLTRYARSERTENWIDPAIVDSYLYDAIATTTYDPNSKTDPLRTLFELLLPRSLKEASPDTDKLWLNLDSVTAKYPWEMLIDGWSRDGKPMVIAKQILRQLDTRRLRENPKRAIEPRALVIGDPPGGDEYYFLKGAREEAHVVSTLLKSNDFDVNAIISDHTTDAHDHSVAFSIIDALLQSEYSILHVAAHGAYTEAIEGKSDSDVGLVIGPEKEHRLTPSYIKNMRYLPTLVFLNCCNLGYIDESDETLSKITAPKGVRFNEIAANLATAFIEEGSKVVIAAGWLVDDFAAKLFAETFFKKITSGRTLADSINAARQIAYAQAGSVNTFGAYQCWGDPSFVLDTARRTSGKAGNRADDFCSITEILVQVENIKSETVSATGARITALIEKLDELVDILSNTFSVSTRINGYQGARDVAHEEYCDALAEFGLAYAELGQFETAIAMLRDALIRDRTSLSYRHLEFLGNIEARHAAEIALSEVSGKPISSAYAIDDLLASAEKRIIKLHDDIVLTPFSAQYRSNRLNLASVYKRKLMTLSTPAADMVDSSLDRIFALYGEGWTGAPESARKSIVEYIKIAAQREVELDTYGFVNLVQSHIIKSWYPAGREATTTSRPLAECVRRFYFAQMKRSSDAATFWDGVGEADALIMLMMNRSLCTSVDVCEFDAGELSKRIQAVYRDAQKRFGSTRQWYSKHDQVRFLRFMLEHRPGQSASARTLLDACREIEMQLADYVHSV